MASIQENDRKAAFLFVGDFNAHHREWLNSVSPTDCHGLRAIDFSTESGCDQLIQRPIHRSANTLDLLAIPVGYALWDCRLSFFFSFLFFFRHFCPGHISGTVTRRDSKLSVQLGPAV